MRLITCTEQDDPAFNLALEEFLFTRPRSQDGLLLFYRNAPTVVIGRNQNPLAEVDTRFLRTRGIPMVRRMSGGGAVYHDGGNLNFSLLRPNGPGAAPSLGALLQPVVEALQALGLAARRSPYNDIMVDGRKVSGNAQYRTTAGVLTHGTLLVSAALVDLHRALAPNPAVCIASRARPSRPSPVANLTEWRPGLTPQEMTARLTQAFGAAYGGSGLCPLAAAELDAVHRLAAEKYRSWEWNFGRTPDFDYRAEWRFRGGRLGCVLSYRRGCIAAAALEAPPRLRARLQPLAEDWLIGRRLGQCAPVSARDMRQHDPALQPAMRWLDNLPPEGPPLAVNRQLAPGSAAASVSRGFSRESR